MKQIALIAVAGALGAISRYGVVNLIGGRFFPWGTMAVNVIGSFVMGAAYVYFVEEGVMPADLKPFVMTGFLGAFTTYSAFSLEAWQLVDRGDFMHATAYVVGTTTCCFIALFLGVLMARSTI